MIAHYVGGPAHGKEEAVSHLELTRNFFSAEIAPFAPYSTETVPYEFPYMKHEYKRVGVFQNFGIYAWVPPRIRVDFEVELPLRGWSSIEDAPGGKLSGRIAALSGGSDKPVKVLSWEIVGASNVLLRGSVGSIEGPPGSNAIAAAAEATESRIHSVLGNVRIVRSAYSANPPD